MRRSGLHPALLLALLVVLISARSCGNDAPDHVTRDLAAGAHSGDTDLVPLSGTNPTHVVGTSTFHRFRLLTTQDAFAAGRSVAAPAALATRNEQALAHHAAGRFRSAARAFRSLADAARAQKDAEFETQARLRALQSFELIDESAEALVDAQRVLALREGRRDGLGAARSRADVGVIYGKLGNYARAIDHLGPAADEFKRFGMKRLRAHALASMGLVYLKRAEYGPALDVLEDAEKLLEGTRNRACKAYVLNLLGCVHQHVGDTDRARACYEAALTLHRDGESLDRADVLGNLGSIYFHAADYGEAARCYEEAGSTYERSSDHAGQARALFSLGRVKKVQGGYRTALDVYRSALELQDAEASEAARTRCAIAETHLAMGHADEALYEVDTAMENVGLGTARIVRVELLVVGALAWLRKGSPERAVRRIRHALDVLMEVTSGLADEHVIGLRDQRGWVFDAGLAVALRTGRVDLAVEFLEHGRAGALLEGLGGRGAHRGLPPELKEAELEAGQRLALATRRYLSSRAARQRDALRAASDALEAARAGYRAVHQRIQREAKRVASVFHPVPDSLAAIRESLRPDDVFVLYALLPFQAHAVVITVEEARVEWLGNTPDVQAACEALRAGDAGAEPPAALEQRIERLRALVLDPLRLPDNTRRLLISPDRSLCYVPFPLLLSAQPDLEVACLPSGTTLRVLMEERAHAGRGVLALGDPNYVIEYQGRSLHVYAEGVPLEPLPATRAEVTAITGPQDQRLLGNHATVRSLGEVAASRRRWRVIHLACHGLIDPHTPTLSALALTPEPDDDGFLTALEVYGMNLPADLVVLSGCNTGRGHFLRGEGLVGLMRAFMCAGAPRVVASLWKVDDQATRALMTRFHALLREGGISPSRALRRAQAEIRAQPRWHHPRYWAAWVLWGLAD